MNNKVILLVEDNPDDQELTLLALKENEINSEIIIASDGEQALDMLFGRNDTNKVEPDLVLLDLKLPKVSGIDVLKEIREHDESRRLPVVILTTSLEESDIAYSYDNGANSYIRKPVNFKEFVDQIGYIVKYWFLCNRV